MPRVWAWFHNPSAVISLVNQMGQDHRVSVILLDPQDPRDVLVLGPLTRDMACYPFLDVLHQLRRFGVKKSMAEVYAEVLRQGGAVVCIDTDDRRAFGVLHHLQAMT
ncbi:MAG: hypothetical protein OWU84_04850 [Firmicutes bacterium]|nr:hypothetical protein [Bacillota bacterium]